MRSPRAGAGRGSWILPATGGGLLAATGAIHLDLYLTGYSTLPTIGPLFLLQAAAALVLAVGVVLVRHPLVQLAGALFALATLGGYLLSVGVGLFGFHEVRTTAGIVAGIVEIAAFGVLARAGSTTLGPPLGHLASASAPPLVLAAGAALAGVLAASTTAAPASRSGKEPVTAIAVPGYGTVLATPARASLYLLSAERGGKIVCTGGCLSLWPPLLSSGGSPPAEVPGLAGRLGLVRRGPHAEQLTYNGYPLYTYSADPGPRASAGEGIVSFGGTWYLVRAAAAAPGSTPVRRALSH